MPGRLARLLVALVLLGALWGLVLLVAREDAPRRASGAPAPSAPSAGDLSPAPESARLEPALGSDAGDPRPASGPPATRAPVESVDPRALGPLEGVLQVRVLSLVDQAPLAGVPVRVETADGAVVEEARPYGRRHGPGPLASTDSEGRLDVVVPAGRELVLHAGWQHAAIGPRVREPVPPVQPRAFRTVVIELVASPDLEWHGVVIDAETLLPVPDALLRLVGPRSATLRLRSGPRGGVHLALASDGPLDLVVEHPEYALLRHRVGPGFEDASLPEEVGLHRPARLDLRVLRAGVPVPDVQVRLDALPEEGGVPPAWMRRVVGDAAGVALTGTTDAAGRVLLQGLEPLVQHELLVMRGARALLAQRRLPPFAPGEERVLDVVLEDPASIAGRVVDQDGEPVGGVTVGLVRGGASDEEALDPLEVVNTGADGAFSFAQVPPGSYRIAAGTLLMRGAVLAFGPSHGIEGPAAATFSALDLTVAPGQAVEGVEVRAWRGLAIRGVLRVEGEGTFDGSVSASCDEHVVVAPIAEDGTFVLEPLLPRTYTLRLFGQREGWRTTTLDAAAGAEGVVLEARRK